AHSNREAVYDVDKARVRVRRALLRGYVLPLPPVGVAKAAWPPATARGCAPLRARRAGSRTRFRGGWWVSAVELPLRDVPGRAYRCARPTPYAVVAGDPGARGTVVSGQCLAGRPSA